MGPQRGVSSSLLVPVASWLLFASCCIEFCLSHAPPAATVPLTAPQALPWSALSNGTHTSVPQSASSEPLVSQPRYSVPQSLTPKPSVSLSLSPQPSVSQPPSPQPSVSQRLTPKPSVSQPLSLQPSVSQPLSSQPSVSQLLTPKPSVSQPLSPKPSVYQPPSPHPSVSQPLTPKPSVSQPLSPQPSVSQPLSPQPSVSQPLSPQPSVSQPLTRKPSVSQPLSPQPSVSQPLSPQLSVSQPPSPQPSISQPPSPQPSISQPPSPQPSVFQPLNPEPSVSQPPSSQFLVSQLSSPQPFVSRLLSPQPRLSFLLFAISHHPASSDFHQTPKQLYLRPQTSFSVAHSHQSGIVSTEGSGERRDEEEYEEAEYRGKVGRRGGRGAGGAGGRHTERQDIGGLPVMNDSHRDTNTMSHSNSRLSPDTELWAGLLTPYPYAAERLTSEEEEEFGADARRTEKSSRKSHIISREGDKSSSREVLERAHPLDLPAASAPHTMERGARWDSRRGHEEAANSSSSSSNLTIASKRRYPVPLLTRGALELTSGEQDQGMGRSSPVEVAARGSPPYGGLGLPTGLLNVNEMMVNSLRSLEQEYTSEETRVFKEESVSREVEEGEEEGGEKESLEDGTGEPHLKLEVLAAPCVKPEHLPNFHEHEAKKERQLVWEAVTRRPSQRGVVEGRFRLASEEATQHSRNPCSAPPSPLLHRPAPLTSPLQPPTALVTLENYRVKTLLEMPRLSPQPPSVIPKPYPRSTPLPPPLRTRPAITGALVKGRENSLDQKTSKENSQDSPLASTQQPGYKKAVSSRPRGSNRSKTMPLSDGMLFGPVGSSVATKPVRSGDPGDAGPDGLGRLRESTPQGSVYLLGLRAGDSEQSNGMSLAAAPLLGSSSSHKWSVGRAKESESSSHLHLSASEMTHPAPEPLRHALPWPPAAVSSGDAAFKARAVGGEASSGSVPGGRHITRNEKRNEENINPLERREKNMVEVTLVRKNGGGNLKSVTPEGGGGEGLEGERGKRKRGGMKKIRERPQNSVLALNERNKGDDERTSHRVNLAGPTGLTRSQTRRRKRLLKRDSETTAQDSEGGRHAGELESRRQGQGQGQGVLPPLVPRAAFHEALHAAADPHSLGAGESRAAAAPHEDKISIVDEANKAGTGGIHVPGTLEAPPGLAPMPGAKDPPVQHLVGSRPVSSGGEEYSYLPPGFATLDTSEGCQCWQTHDDSFTPEEECRCMGEHIVQLPQNLSTSMDRLSLTKMGLETLGHRNLSVYSASLKELILRDVARLNTFEADVFINMPQLRIIYISHAPRLVKLPPDVFHVLLPSLKVIRIMHTGLTVLPGLSQLLLNHGILHLLDLENNKIKRITTASISIRAIQLLLNNNDIDTVEASAFQGSEIDKLSLKGNTHLTELDPLAFHGVKSLTSLDLSDTGISRLPTEGLDGLETLFLTGTHELKVFPSVYSFKHITTAHLTYPYHCCAFRYPRLHDPAEHNKHEEFLRQMEKEFCGDVTSPFPKTSLMGVGWRRRRRAPPTSSREPSRPPTPQKATEGRRGRRQVLSVSSPDLMKRHHLSPPENQIFGVETNARPVTAPSPPPPTSFGSLLPLLTDPKGTRHESRLNLSPSGGVNEGEKASEEQTQVVIMGSRGGREEGQEKRKEEGQERNGRGVGVQSKVNNNLSYLEESALRGQVKGAEGSLLHRLARSTLEQHNASVPVAPVAPPGYGGGGWGVSLPKAASAARFDEPNSFPKAPEEGVAAPETPLDLGEDPKEALDHMFHSYHSGSFADGGPGEFDDQVHHDFDSEGGFGEVVAGQGEPHEAPDTDQFFHVNEVTVSPEKTVCGGNLSKNYRDVRCYPEPDAFNPCEDIMGNLGLRVAVWAVVVTAVLGNLAVMIVLMSTRFKMTVSKFLMCNLAVADLCMGLYLLIIAIMDLHTIGVYFNSAIYWQNGPGCKVAGFLTVFASELSILTLTVITLERWYAITYAIHLNKRLRLSVAVRVMVLAWLYALTMAALPLLGVSGYSKTSICLPMETADGADQAYLLILLITNGLAFVLICVCYAKMYCSIAGNNLAANTSDTTVAKRMALLVFTDFACWAPIAFFGLTAVCGYPLISVTHAKFLLVFFYPLNSCANPYLYAILTKQYRRDLFLMLARHGFFTRRALKYKGGVSTNTWLNHHQICVSGGPGGGGSGGPSRRISTLTQITTCGEWRGRARDGSEESLPRQASPPRIKSISAELAVPLSGPPGCGSCGGGGGGGGDRRLSDVCRRLQPVAEVHDGRTSPQAAAATSGSPHPIKNCYARMSFTPEQEAILQRYASDRQPGVTPAQAQRRPSATDSRDEPMPLSVYTPSTPDTITTPVSPSVDHAV